MLVTGLSIMPASAHDIILSCSNAPYLTRLSDTSYKFGGTVSCNATGTITYSCRVIHRHSTYWHTHGGALNNTWYSAFTGTLNSATIAGTNGDTYKSNCNFSFTHDGVTITGTAESSAVNL